MIDLFTGFVSRIHLYGLVSRVSHNNVFSPKTSGVLGIVYHYDESHSDFFSEFF